MDRASYGCYGVYEYVRIFCKHSERTEGQIPIIPERKCGKESAEM